MTDIRRPDFDRLANNTMDAEEARYTAYYVQRLESALLTMRDELDAVMDLPPESRRIDGTYGSLSNAR